ncbi:hypothetical protein IWX90DRAFT_445911 [Phyllosticta citrichinensis]|uniref:Uncharacterized protein n=1 Tax=Phyllosticta citrichinensis TaxID=1130410 RepID=A0ABR1XFG3_9PEZI
MATWRIWIVDVTEYWRSRAVIPEVEGWWLKTPSFGHHRLRRRRRRRRLQGVYCITAAAAALCLVCGLLGPAPKFRRCSSCPSTCGGPVHGRRLQDFWQRFFFSIQSPTPQRRPRLRQGKQPRLRPTAAFMTKCDSVSYSHSNFRNSSTQPNTLLRRARRATRKSCTGGQCIRDSPASNSCGCGLRT